MDDFNAGYKFIDLGPGFFNFDDFFYELIHCPKIFGIGSVKTIHVN